MPAFPRVLALLALALCVNALAANRAQVARHVHHDVIAKHKRSAPTCIPRPSDTPTPTPTPTPSTPASTSTTPTPTPSSAPPSAPVSGSKKWGLAWGADPQYLPNFALPRVGYIYNWSPTYPTPVPSGIVPIPMLWGWKQDQVSTWYNTVVPGYASLVFAINEPNEPGEANMSPQDAVSFWLEYIQPLAKEGYKLVAPPCTDDQAGLDWYAAFFPACYAAGCTFDGLAFHGYNTDPQSIINYATTLHQTYGLGIYITEFADQNFSGVGGQADMNAVWDFAGRMFDFVENTAWVMAAFPFGIMNDLQGVNVDNSLITGDGHPTALAYYYFGN